MRPIKISGNSMNDFFKSGDIVFAQMGYYQCNEVQRSDIVLIKRTDTSEILIKNVLMLPGDQFYLRGFAKGFHLLVNDSVLLTTKGKPYFFPLESEKVFRYYESNFFNKVPESTYFVFGTKFDGSTDSSSFGPVYKYELIGRINKVK